MAILFDQLNKFGTEASSEAAGEMSPEQAAAIAAQEGFFKVATRLGEQQEERGTALWNEYIDNYLPGERRFAAGAFAGIDPNQAVGAAVSSAEQQASLADRSRTRGLSALGIDPSSPRALAATAQGGLQRAALRTDAANRARAGARAENFNRRFTATQLGRGLIPPALGAPGAAAAIQGNAARGLSGALQSAAGQQFAQQQFATQSAQFAQQLNAQREQAKAAERAALFGSIGQTIGTIGGFLGGGPAGASAGGQIGSSAFNPGFAAGRTAATTASPFGGFVPQFNF